MIDIKQGELLDLLPDKSKPNMIALSYALKRAMDIVIKKADGSRTFAAVQDLPNEILDLLAIEMRSMYYDDTMPIEIKRNIIENTLMWYHKAGTPAAVREMTATLFGSGDIIEWFDVPDGSLKPGEFDIVTDQILDPMLTEKLNETIKKVKNIRSHLHQVKVERHTDLKEYCTVYFGMSPCIEIKEA